MKAIVPQILLFSRVLLTFIVVGIAAIHPPYETAWVLTMMYFGVLTDIFDGILARKMNISTTAFRVQDTVVDVFFYLSIFYYITATSDSGVIVENIPGICIILFLEGLMYAVSLGRFAKLPSPHAILSKAWGIYLVIEFTLLIAGVKGSHFAFALAFGMVAHVDRVMIYVLLRDWDHDIPSSYHAWQLRQGGRIARRKLFNG